VLRGHTHPQPTALPEVHRTFVRVYEQRTAKRKTEALRELLDRLTPREAKYIGKILTGDLRIGLRAGLVEEGIARAFGAPLADVSWASMLTGDIGEVALLARRGGLRSARLRLMHPLQFMLASPEEDAAAIMRRVGGEAWVEDKYDGIRGQLHKESERVVLYSRDLNEVTAAFHAGLPDPGKQPGRARPDFRCGAGTQQRGLDGQRPEQQVHARPSWPGVAEVEEGAGNARCGRNRSRDRPREAKECPVRLHLRRV